MVNQKKKQETKFINLSTVANNVLIGPKKITKSCKKIFGMSIVRIAYKKITIIEGLQT